MYNGIGKQNWQDEATSSWSLGYSQNTIIILVKWVVMQYEVYADLNVFYVHCLKSSQLLWIKLFVLIIRVTVGRYLRNCQGRTSSYSICKQTLPPKDWVLKLIQNVCFFAVLKCFITKTNLLVSSWSLCCRSWSFFLIYQCSSGQRKSWPSRKNP